MSLQFPVSTKRNGHETNTCKPSIYFILFHSEKLLLAFDSRNCCHGSALEVSDGVSAYNQRTSSSQKSGGMHCHILQYLRVFHFPFSVICILFCATNILFCVTYILFCVTYILFCAAYIFRFVQRIFSVYAVYIFCFVQVYFPFCAVVYIFRFVQRIFSVLCRIYFLFCAAYIFSFVQRKYIFHYTNEILKGSIIFFQS